MTDDPTTEPRTDTIASEARTDTTTTEAEPDTTTADGTTATRRTRPRATPSPRNDRSGSNHSRESSPISRRGFVRTAAVAGASALALGTTGAAAADTESVARESCEDWATFELSDGNWHLMNNKWGMPDSDQCIRVFEDGSYGYEFSAVGDGINYPEVFCGSRPWGSSTGVDEFPLSRGAVDELVLEWDVEIDIDGGNWDLAEEWWLLDGEPDPENPSITHEIMLVLDWGPEHDHEMVEENVRQDRFGNQIDHWADYSHSQGWNFHIFRIAGGASTGQVDFTEIIDYMTEAYDVSEDLTLTGVEVGNEYWKGIEGDVRFETCDLTINGTTYESGVDDGGSDTIGVGEYEAQDTTGDGLYNDVDGDGDTDFDDVSALADHLDSEGVQDNPDAFDFADNDRVGFADVLELLRRV